MYPFGRVAVPFSLFSGNMGTLVQPMAKSRNTKVTAHIRRLAPFPALANGKQEMTVELILELKDHRSDVDRGSIAITLCLNGNDKSDFSGLDEEIRAEARHLLAVASSRLRKPVLPSS